MGALLSKLRSRPAFMSICSEIFVMTGWKMFRLDETAEKRGTA